MSRKATSKTAAVKTLLFLGVLVVLFLVDRVSGFSDTLIHSQFISDVHVLVKENLAVAIVIYLVSMVVACVLLAVPGFTFALIAGSLFGPYLGTLLCALGASLGAMLSFVLGRFFLRDSLKPLLEKNRLLKKWLFDETGINQVILLMVTRLVPVFPYNLQNFAYGLTSMRFGVYALFSSLFMLPGVALYTFAAAGVFNPAERPYYFAVAGILTLLVIGGAFLLRKRYLAEAE